MPKSSAFYTTGTFSVCNEFTEVTLLHASENGYSEVYVAERHGKKHVLKKLTHEEYNNPRYQQLLQKEFDISYQLSHQGIVHTLGMEDVEGLGVCIIQEFVDGISWDEFFANKVSQKETRRVLCELCDAIDYMHQHQVIHRDLKPQNILITRNGHHPVIIDFGLADRDCYVILKEPAGTTDYASPEQQQPGVLDNRSDIYSLGVLIDGISCVHDFKLHRIAKKCLANNPGKRFVCASEIKLMLTPVHWQRWLYVGIICLAGLIFLFLYSSRTPNHDARIATLQKQNSIQQSHIDSMQSRIGQLMGSLDSMSGVNKTFNERIEKEDQEAANLRAAKEDMHKLAKDSYYMKWSKYSDVADSAQRSNLAFLDVYQIDWQPIIQREMIKHNLTGSSNSDGIKKTLREEWYGVLFDLHK